MASKSFACRQLAKLELGLTAQGVEMIADEVKVHVFQAAGLGIAPFRFVGIETDADRGAIQRERESSGLVFTTNHCTCCDYCGQAIHNAFVVMSSDGRTFKVGCDCIRKTGDKGLIRHVTEEESAKRRIKADERRKAKCHREQELIAAFTAGRCGSLRNMPHPKGRDGSAHDYVSWCLSNRCFGASVLKIIEGAMQ